MEKKEPRFNPLGLQADLETIRELPRLQATLENVDKVIELLSAAREQVAGALDPHTASLTMTKLQNPTTKAFELVNESLRTVSGAQKKLGRTLDNNYPLKALPTDHDAMAAHPALINRAIAMHFLREGQFAVASTFISEAQDDGPRPRSPGHETEDDDPDEVMADGVFESKDDCPGRHRDLASFQSRELQNKFADMYRILQQLQARNLLPAIDWARTNSGELEARGSNLEFELSKLQYVWLFKGPSVNGLPDDQHNGLPGALSYARQHLSRFQERHLREIKELANAMVFARNIADSPYRHMFATDNAFSDVAASFTREFCSLLGLSAESPLYVAVTAGALALPQLLHYVTKARLKGTEWTSAEELAFETPLPESMFYHSIFVCPVEKAQTTEENPPMMIPCGHVLSEQTLLCLAKGTGTRFKCPYCPSEGQIKDARQIIL